jgi:hypothetical protein
MVFIASTDQHGNSKLQIKVVVFDNKHYCFLEDNSIIDANYDLI